MSLNVLVVDDSSVMRKMIIRTLNMSGVSVGDIFEAEDGQKGIELLEEKWIDMLFIDVNMPVMDGIEMLTHVRNKPETKDLPVLIISTESNPQRINQISENRAGFVHKPFTPEILREKINELTGIRKD